VLEHLKEAVSIHLVGVLSKVVVVVSVVGLLLECRLGYGFECTAVVVEGGELEVIPERVSCLLCLFGV